MKVKNNILRLVVPISIISYVMVCIIPEWISSMEDMIYLYRDADYSKYSVYITIVIGILMMLQLMSYRVLFTKKYRNPILIGLSLVQIYMIWVHPALHYFGMASIYVDMLKSLLYRGYNYSATWYVIAIALLVFITICNICVIVFSIIEIAHKNKDELQKDKVVAFSLRPKKICRYIAVIVCVICVIVYGVFLSICINKYVINAPIEENIDVEKGEEWIKQIFGIEPDEYKIKEIEGEFSEEAYVGHCKIILQVERDDCKNFIKHVEEKYGTSAKNPGPFDASISKRSFDYENGDRYYGGYCEPQRELDADGEYMISKSTRRFIMCSRKWDGSYEVILYYTE